MRYKCTPHRAPLAKESNIIYASRLGALRRWEEQSDGRHVGELRGSGIQRERKLRGSYDRQCCAASLLDCILPHLTSYGNVKLLQGLLIRSVFKVQVVHIRKLQCQRPLKQTYFAQKKHTYECHFGGRLIAWTGFEQQRS